MSESEFLASQAAEPSVQNKKKKKSYLKCGVNKPHDAIVQQRRGLNLELINWTCAPALFFATGYKYMIYRKLNKIYNQL